MENSTEEAYREEISSDVDQHESPLKDAVLVDDSDKPKEFIFLQGVQLICNFIELIGDFFHFKDHSTGEVVKVKKHNSITRALNHVNFSPKCKLNINCIADDKFIITKEDTNK